MKTTTFVSAALALAGSAVAAPQPAHEPQGFGAIASRSGTVIHQRELHANHGFIWIGKPTSSYCPLKDQSTCPAGHRTVFVGGHNRMAMNVEVPGGQRAYISPDGELAYTAPHSSEIPAGSITNGFSKQRVDGQNYSKLTHWAGAFKACAVEKGGPWKVHVGNRRLDPLHCFEFDALTVDTNEVGAWEYL